MNGISISVDEICSGLSKALRGLSPKQRNEAALDLHDICHGCQLVAKSIAALAKARSESAAFSEVCTIYTELFLHLAKFHLKSLKHVLDDNGMRLSQRSSSKPQRSSSKPQRS